MSHFIYTKNMFQIKDINKSSKKKQLILHNKYFKKEKSKIAQLINFLNNKNKLILKIIH